MNNRLSVLLTRWLRPLATTCLLLMLGTLAGPAAMAVSVNGSASVWGYVREDSVAHTQVAPMLNLNVRDFGIKSLRFETTLRGFTDFRHGKSEDRRLGIWRGVLIYAPVQSPWEVRLGQQWLTEGVGRGNVAGLWARWKIDRVSDVTAYAGQRLLSSISLEDRYREQGFAAGIHGRSKAGRFNIGASYFFVGKKSKALFSAAGVEASGLIIPEVSTQGRLDINLERGSIERAQLLADWSVIPAVDVTGEFRIQQPRIFEDSYFKQFLGEVSTTYARLGAVWSFYRQFYVRGTGVTLFSENPDPLYKAQAALGFKYAEVGYTRWLSTDKGEMNGFFGQANWVCPRGLVEAFAGFDFARGSNAETNLRPATESQALYFGGAVNPSRALTLTARAEQVKSPRIESEWRGLFAATVRFSNLK